MFHIHRAQVYESIWNLFNGNKMDHISKIFSKWSFTDCNFLLIHWKSIHSIQYSTLAVALYRPNFFRRSLWDGKLVKMFLLLCKCIFNFFLQLIFGSSMAFLDNYGYKFYAVFFCSLSFSSTFPGVWTFVEVEWVRWRLFFFLTLLKFHNKMTIKSSVTKFKGITMLLMK